MIALLSCAILLMAWGSLRAAMTPLGYWLAWAAWAGVALGVSEPWRQPSGWAVPRWLWIPFALLLAGMLLAAFGATPAFPTLYQCAKIAAIAVVFVVMWWLVRGCDDAELLVALHLALWLVVLSFFLSKLYFRGAYRLGGAREGMVLAQAGVLWKAGVFLMPWFLVDWLVRPARRLGSSLALGACLFLVLADGSRTGLILVGAMLAATALVLWRLRDGARLRGWPKALLPVLAVSVGLLALNAGLNMLHAQGPAGGSGGASMMGLVDGTLAPIADNRLGSGDSPRKVLLHHGLETARRCFPLGCGFGSTAIDAGYGIPMNVHNAYLGALADFGLAGFVGMAAFALVALRGLRVLWASTDAPSDATYYRLAATASALAYCAALMLHTFSSELSEWGYLMLALAFAHKPLTGPA